jgi:leader peptidase (prepilin peptidase)/N-methyltransferase
VITAPYLAGLSRTVPDRSDPRWWRPTGTSRARRIATAVVGALLGALCAAAAGWTAVLPGWLVLALFATPLVLIDYEQHRLPDRLLAPLAAAAAGSLTGAAATTAQWPALGRAGAAAAIVFAALFVLNLLAPRSFGMGDVKLAAILGGYLGWFGWGHVLWGLFLGFLLGALVSLGLVLARRATLRTAIPFGPALLVGAALAPLLGG